MCNLFLADLLRGAADGNGAAAGLRQRRMGTHKGDASLWPDTHYTSGELASSSSSSSSYTHLLLPQDPLIFAGRSLDLQFRMSRPLTDFMATLHKNGIEEKKLAKYVTHSTLDDIVTFIIK